MSTDESITGLPDAVAAMGALPMPVAPEPVGEFYAYLHHDNRVPHDLPEPGGAAAEASREDEPAKCRCDEADADPYECEAEDCSGYFSELSPFGGSPYVAERDAKVSRKCGQCDYRTSVWHVDDGSAEEELHRHVSRVHGGQLVGGAS